MNAPANINSNQQKPTINYSYLPELSGHLLGLAHLQSTRICNGCMSEIGLTTKQFVALEFIACNPHISQRKIAEQIGVTSQLMVNILDVLTKRGFVERVRSTVDRRQHTIQITPTGENVLPKVRELAFDVESKFQEETGLSDAELQTLISILRKATNR
ncbi:MAG: MarR family winged helix-turn-helix transcriptional regulator [Anaerolineae bacterium]